MLALASLREVQALVVVMPILAFVVFDDLCNFRIRNEAVLALVALFAAFTLANGDMETLKSHFTFGLALFALFLGMYYFGMMGGGDVKLLAVASLWLGPENALPFAVFLGIFALAYAAGAKMNLLPSRTVNGRVKVPFGPSIALAWMVALLVKTTIAS